MPTAEIHPYLFFEGRCDEAIAFYRRAIGAEVAMLARYGDSPAGVGHDRHPDKVMYARLTIGDATVLLSDGECSGRPSFSGVALSLTVAGVDEVDRLFTGLADGGQVRMAPAKTFFSARFAMVVDRFGVLWMIYDRG